MKLVINNKNDYDINEFMNYLSNYIYKLFIYSADSNNFIRFDNKYKINSFNIISYLLQHLKISKIKDSTYIIGVDKNIKMNNGTPMYAYLKWITYGDRLTKGYPIVYNIFKMVSSNIETIYDEWSNGRALI